MISFLTFSDSAKYAQVAKRLIAGKAFSITHSFFDYRNISQFAQSSFFPANFKPLSSYILSLIFRLLSPTDESIALAGLILLSLCGLLLLVIAKELYDNKAAIISLALFVVNSIWVSYAKNFSTEILFTFEILSFLYLFFASYKKTRTLSVLPLFLMFFTRPNYFVFYLSTAIYLLILKLTETKKQYPKFIIPLLVILFGLGGFYLFQKTTTIQSIIGFHWGAINIHTQNAPGIYIRGGLRESLSITEIGKKVFYNIYNFLKDSSRLAPAGVFIFFILGFFLKDLPDKVKKFNLFTLITLNLFILSSALTLPNARYVHPVIPLVFISASISLVEIIKKAKLEKPNLALSAVAFFILLPSIGHFTLDARFRAQKYNPGKPPVYREISRIMAEHIPKDHLIITNLDAWAAWYEGLTTMWFPLEPEMLEGYQDKVDYIVITNYKEHDADFALREWKEVVYSPDNIQNKFLSRNYQVLTTFQIEPEEIYENKSYRGTILTRYDQEN